MKRNEYPYIRGDGVAVAQPLFQEDGGGSIPTSPLQFEFHETDLSTACQLCASWHSRLPVLDPRSAAMGPCVGYVAEFENGLYAVAWWSQPVARMLNGRGLIELRRMAICEMAPKNTASRMLSWMVKDIAKRFPKVVGCISYQDTEVHTGTIYKASGWTSKPPTRRDGDWRCNQRVRSAPVSNAPKVVWEMPIRRSPQ